MNTCASCHAGTRGGSFKLVRTFGDGSSNHRATQHNLAAVVAQLNLASWQTSPLLIKAVSVHGEVNKSPIKSRQTPAYQMLEEWVQLAVSNLPPRETASAGVFGPSNAPPARTFAATATQPKSEIVPASLTTPEKAAAKEVEAKASDKENQTKPAPEVKCETKAKSASPADPFDPSLFNQQTQR